MTLNPNRTVPFELNSDVRFATVLDNSQDMAGIDAEDFWCHTVVTAYQGNKSNDGDNETEARLRGVTGAEFPPGSGYSYNDDSAEFFLKPFATKFRDLSLHQILQISFKR